MIPRRRPAGGLYTGLAEGGGGCDQAGGHATLQGANFGMLNQQGVVELKISNPATVQTRQAKTVPEGTAAPAAGRGSLPCCELPFALMQTRRSVCLLLHWLVVDCLCGLLL